MRDFSTESGVNHHHQVATFAAGCFWSAQLHFECVSGVLSTQVGFINGRTRNPTYEAVCTDTTGHALAIQILFDDTAITYEDLLDSFWAMGSTVSHNDEDLGSPFRSGIYFHAMKQRAAALKSKAKQCALHPNDDILTEIEPAGEFYPADEYHQRYLEKGGQCSDHSDSIPCCGKK
ncbi:unnamed protein product [Aphanomyces euteiches]|uniref:peptide-methionine (S)-S-oxide reductase n=1 Tax=Aphanomyces euteiches TaxID=100861 RepID=A0A6G0XPJ7_9STRA|nr:hypothetical protein Ae201684_002746 [Aphanomyces euteiches]KAH9093290.1 hypothetical protein Ae201684P_008946 [Aphanomyces euteiches]KAH9131894.1 hypothetical protein AeRB84_021609 [Aphanomyces euteiches]